MNYLFARRIVKKHYPNAVPFGAVAKTDSVGKYDGPVIRTDWDIMDHRFGTPLTTPKDPKRIAGAWVAVAKRLEPWRK